MKSSPAGKRKGESLVFGSFTDGANVTLSGERRGENKLAGVIRSFEEVGHVPKEREGREKVLLRGGC